MRSILRNIIKLKEISFSFSFGKLIILLLFVFSIICNKSFSQQGSDYSIFGVGDIQHTVGASFDGLAGTSIAMPFENSINTKNPALWSYVTSTRLQAGYRFNQHFISSKKSLIQQNNGKVDGIFGIFSIDTALGISASFGVYSYSSVNYFIAHYSDLKVEDVTLVSRRSYQGIGGLTNAYLGGSIKILNNLSFGASASLMFGKTLYNDETTIYDIEYYTSYTLQKDIYKGGGFTFGLFYTPIENFSIGAFFESHTNLSIESNQTYLTTFHEDTISAKTNIPFPSKYGIGFSYLSGKFLFGYDFSIQDFSGFKYREGTKGKFRNSYQLSAGVSRLGNKSYSSPYLDKITYKFGIGYNQLYYTVDNTGLSEYFGSIGMSFPLPGTGILDAAITIGSRGTTSNNLIHDYFGRLSVDISIGESWFKPFKRD